MATWWEITFTGEPADDDLEHVAEMIKQGFTSGQLTEEPPVTWCSQAPAVTPGGDVGGDYQAGEAWSVRFVNDHMPGSLITEYVYAEHDPKNNEYLVTVQTEYLTCTDPADPGGTETWSDYDYDTEADPLAYASAGEAEEAARKLAENFEQHPERHHWDGMPRL